MKKIGIISLFLLFAANAAWPAVKPTAINVFTPRDGLYEPLLPGCFDSDPNIGGLDRNAHLVWAQRQTVDGIARNLPYKVGMLFNCQSVDGEKLAAAFADISVLVAGYAPNAACFGGDTGVIGRDRTLHYNWARTKTRDALRNNLQWKVGNAAKCTDVNYLAAFFADVSVVVANAGVSGGSGGGGGGSSCGNDYGLQAPGFARAGSRVRVRFAYRGARPTSQSDWIGLFRAGSTQYTEWYWVKDIQGCEVEFAVPGSGAYEFRYLLEGSNDKIAARTPLTVQ